LVNVKVYGMPLVKLSAICPNYPFLCYRIRELIEAAGCKLVYLPAYSPDLNRIKKCWAWLKHRIRKLLRNSENLRDAMESVLAVSAS
jgi:hypothetical protein